MSEIIDLTLDDDYCVGSLSRGIIRMTASNTGILNKHQISFDEIVQIESQPSLALLSTYVMDAEWLFPKIFSIPKVYLAIDGKNTNMKLPIQVGNICIHSPPRPQFPAYGTMHIKFIILFYEQWARIVVSSANLMEHDYSLVQNIVFIQDVPQRPKSGNGVLADQSKFKTDLDHLLSKMNFPPKLFENCDFGQVRVDLVYSIPGMHTLDNGNRVYGLSMLKRNYPKHANVRAVEVLGSSLGALSEQWLLDFSSCYLHSTNNDNPNRNHTETIKIVFPTMEYAVKSPLGPQSFGTIFCQGKNWNSPKYPKRAFYRCESVFGSGQPLHAKIITCFNNHDEPISHYIGSANFTPSAWGNYVKDGRRIMIANYELGVCFDASLNEELCADTLFPFPYCRPAQRYGEDDSPWMQSEYFHS